MEGELKKVLSGKPDELEEHQHAILDVEGRPVHVGGVTWPDGDEEIEREVAERKLGGKEVLQQFSEIEREVMEEEERELESDESKDAMVSGSLLRALVDLRDRQVQKARISFQLRRMAIERGADAGNEYQLDVLSRYEQRFNTIEKELNRDIQTVVSGYPIYERLSKITGVGPTLAAKLIALVDIKRSDHVSDLWRHAGYAVIDGQRERPVKGERLHYSIRLKTTCYLISLSFLRSRSPYTTIYYQAKHHYQVTHPDWTKMHQHLAALRKQTKAFLQHLWLTWRRLEGLSYDEPWHIAHCVPYPHANGFYKATEFGWPED